MGTIVTYNVAIPGYFIILFFLGIISILIVLGVYIRKVNGVNKNFPKIFNAVTRISEILLQHKATEEPLFSSEKPMRFVSSDGTLIKEESADVPLFLTKAGEGIIKEIKFLDFYNANKKALLDYIKKANPKTLADIGEVCKSAMLQAEESLPHFEPIKQWTYKHSHPIAKILFVCAIKLRDLVAQELNMQEVSKF